MKDPISGVLLLVGATFMLLAAIGILRMPDLFMRMQVNSKASTLGIACVLLGVAVHFGTLGVMTRALAIIVFFFLTQPVGAHMLARAAYFVGVPLWEGTIADELRGRYDPRTHRLASGPPEAGASAEQEPRGRS